MPLFIHQGDALDILAKLEGADWLTHDTVWSLRVDSGACANTATYAKRCWHTLHTEHGAVWKDAADPPVGVIYGAGGIARYVVREDGEVLLDGSSTHEGKHAAARALGVRLR